MTSPHDQSQYQVRFDWGTAGVATVATDVGVIVVVDVLETSPSSLAAHEWPKGSAVISGSLRNRAAVAQWVLARQAEKGDRFSVAIIGEGAPRGDGSIRFAVEDQLGAGAIIDALADVGIDYCSPEAAAACASFTALRTGVGHLISASGSGKELLGRNLLHLVDQAADVDSSTHVPVLAE